MSEHSTCGEYLRSVQIDGEEWTVRLVSSKDTEEIEWCEGKVLITEGIILINANVAVERRFTVLLHEIDHVLAWNHGANYQLREQFGNDRAEKLEESWLQSVVPARRACMQYNGWLKVPLLLTAREKRERKKTK